MVPDSGTPARADQLRPLNAPRPVQVLTRDGVPAVLVLAGSPPRRERVARIQDTWRIDDEWWRHPISRCYFQVVLAGGALRTLYHDLIDDAWYEQTY